MYRVLLVIVLQEEVSLFVHKFAILRICQPRLTAIDIDDACGTQDHQAGEQTQNCEADHLAACDQWTGGMR